MSQMKHCAIKIKACVPAIVICVASFFSQRKHRTALLCSTMTEAAHMFVRRLSPLYHVWCIANVPHCVQDYRTAFCLNCGGSTDVKVIMNALTPSARDNVRFAFIDSHRPIHHSFNDDNDTNYVIFHDPDGGDVPVNVIPRADVAFEQSTSCQIVRGNTGRGDQLSLCLLS
jgi:hypothetical protein